MKHKKTKQVSNEDPIFVELQNPSYLRREILSGAIGCIDVLKNYEVFKDFKVLKATQTLEVKKIISSLKKDYNDLKTSIPNTGRRSDMSMEDPFSHHEPKHVEVKQEHKHQKKEKVETMPPGIKRLEKELELIKNKLNTL